MGWRGGGRGGSRKGSNRDGGGRSGRGKWRGQIRSVDAECITSATYTNSLASPGGKIILAANDDYEPYFDLGIEIISLQMHLFARMKLRGTQPRLLNLILGRYVKGCGN